MGKVGWIIFSVIVVLVLGGLIAWARIANPPVDLSGINHNSIIGGISQNGNIGDHTKGSTDNKILLIEYGDFQCPSCQAAAPNVSTLLEEYGDKITFVFRNFPLTNIHPNARAAAGAAEAAGLQGKFWEMHDILYNDQNEWGNLDATQRTNIFRSYATALGLDAEKFDADFASAEVNKKISFDRALGNSLSVSATPSFFLDGEKLDTATSNGIVQSDLTLIREKLDALTK